ncbi:MAG: transferrin-binding protein-like solute binding protein [Pseudooceanicola sp.]
MKNFASIFPLVMIVSACGGGGGGTTKTPIIPPYETLASNAASTSALKGTAVRYSSPGGFVPDNVSVSGNLTHSTGAISFTDGTTSLSDPDGRNANGSYTDGRNRLSTDGSTGISAGYEYVTLFHFFGPGSDSHGVYGIPTQTSDVPTLGSATYQGRANVAAFKLNILRGDFVANMNNGDSAVKADFESGTVDVEMNNFRSTDLYGNISTAPLDEMTTTGMTISGNEFSGGTVTTRLNGQQVDIAGSGATQSASGVFYGYDPSISAPDEVGGQALISDGDAIHVRGVFVAD